MGWVWDGLDLCAGLLYEHRFAMLIILPEVKYLSEEKKGTFQKKKGTFQKKKGTFQKKKGYLSEEKGYFSEEKVTFSSEKRIPFRRKRVLFRRKRYLSEEKRIPDNRWVDESNGEGESDPAGNGKQHKHLPSLEPVRDAMPERCGKIFNDWSNSNQEPTLSSIHAQTLEVDGEQREEGTKGSKEQEIKGLGNVHLILDHLDRPPETRWFEGLLPCIDAVVIVEARLFPLR